MSCEGMKSSTRTLRLSIFITPTNLQIFLESEPTQHIVSYRNQFGWINNPTATLQTVNKQFQFTLANARNQIGEQVSIWNS